MLEISNKNTKFIVAKAKKLLKIASVFQFHSIFIPLKIIKC